jgi:hypothetical protein
MSASAVINGIPVNFGFQGAPTADGTQGILITGVTGTLLQSAEQSKVAECEKVKDGNGNEVVHAWANLHDEVSLEWIIAGSSLAASITNTTASLKTPGAMIAITGCTSMPSLVGTCWEVQSGVKVQGSNTAAKKVTFPIHCYPGITGVAS